MNILRSTLAISAVALFITCGEPSGELSNEKLARIIADMHISEISLMRHEESLQDSLSHIYVGKLEAIHEVGRDQIKREVEALQEDRSRQAEVYSTVVTILQDLEKELKEKNDPMKKYKKEE